MSEFPFQQWVAKAAREASLLTCGLETGALLFASAVSVRVIDRAIADEDVDFIRTFFPVWWPYGRDLMAPLGVTMLASNAVAAYGAHGRGEMGPRNAHLAAALAAGGIIAWTVCAMSEDIQSLRDGTAAETLQTARNFGRKHHVRLLAAGAGFIALLYAYHQGK